jgi:hypothetical protein
LGEGQSKAEKEVNYTLPAKLIFEADECRLVLLKN